MDDKDSLFTISHNNENNELNSSDINSDTDVLNNNSEHTVVEADSDNCMCNYRFVKQCELF